MTMQSNLQTTAKKKTFNFKFNANLVNHLYKNAIQPVIFPKIRTTNNGICQSIIIPAQGNIGANVSATNIKSIIHEYWEYDIPVEVGVFSEETKKETTLQALGEGKLKIISDQGLVMNWSVLYTPKSTGTVLSPDNYHQNNLSKYLSFYHMGNSDNNVK